MSEWIKFEKSTSDKPEIYEMADILGIDPDAVVGKCCRIWSWFDTHSSTGDAPVTSRALLDRIAGVTGFTNAMIAVGWLSEEDGFLSIVAFDRHNGATAKKRAQTRERMRKLRKGYTNSDGAGVTDASLEGEGESTTHTLSFGGGEGGDSEAEASPAHLVRRGFPTRKEVLDYAASRGWDTRSAAAFWLHHDSRKSQGNPYSPEWHWWSQLEKWIIDDFTRGRASGGAKGGAKAKATIDDYTPGKDWTPDQMKF